MPNHILVIDDEAEIRSMLSEALAVAGFRVTAVPSDFEAVRVVQTDAPHLVLTDLQLEHEDGFTVVEHIKAAAPAIPIIMLTGVLVDPAEIPPSIAEKIAAYLPKTTALAQILREVKRHLPPRT